MGKQKTAQLKNEAHLFEMRFSFLGYKSRLNLVFSGDKT